MLFVAHSGQKSTWKVAQLKPYRIGRPLVQLPQVDFLPYRARIGSWLPSPMRRGPAEHGQRMLTSRLAVNVDCLTGTHRLSCRVPVGSTGLITALNDPMHSLLEAEDVYFSRLQQPAKIVAHHEAASLNKNTIALVVVKRREDLGPQGIARGGYTRVGAVPVTLTTAQFEVTGIVEMLKQFD